MNGSPVLRVYALPVHLLESLNVTRLKECWRPNLTQCCYMDTWWRSKSSTNITSRSMCVSCSAHW